MGSPWNAALWLAQKLIDDGKKIKSGDVILTGGLSQGYGGKDFAVDGRYTGNCPELGQVSIVAE